MLFGAGMTFNLDSQHPLLLMMPELMQMHELATDEPAIPHLLEAMTSELALDRVGAGGMLTRLADVVAAALIRNWVEKGCGSAGWVAAARDPGIGRVLAAIHRDPTRDWTVEALAERHACVTLGICVALRQCRRPDTGPLRRAIADAGSKAVAAFATA